MYDFLISGLILLGVVVILLSTLLRDKPIVALAPGKVAKISKESTRKESSPAVLRMDVAALHQVPQHVAKQVAVRKESRFVRINVNDVDANPSSISNICYINMDKNPERNELMKVELSNQHFPESTVIERFVGIPVPGNGAKGCFLSHLNILSQAIREKYGHTMILEDDFVFAYSRDILESHISKVDKLLKGRWDVIVLGQYVTEWQPLELSDPKVFRLLRSTTTSGYIVNKNYIQDLFLKWNQAFEKIKDHEPFEPEDNLDQIQTHFQRVDIWIGFERPLGRQRAGATTISDGWADNSWSCNSAHNRWFHGVDKSRGGMLLLQKPFKSKKVAVCLVATGNYYIFLHDVMRSCYDRFVKPHELEFHVHADQLDKIPDMFEGSKIYKYFTERKGFPGDTLYRYHYILRGEERLKEVDFIFYMDADYYVYNVPDTDLMASTGLIATTHLHALRESPEKHFRLGSVDVNTNSTAFVGPEEPMIAYFCGGFQGGTSDSFLEACRTMKQNIDIDDSHSVMAKWHDESHWNRYLINHPPSTILSQSYVYPENCLSKSVLNVDSTCSLLRDKNIVPIMLALSKDHKKIRMQNECKK